MKLDILNKLLGTIKKQEHRHLKANVQGNSQLDCSHEKKYSLNRPFNMICMHKKLLFLPRNSPV